MVQANHEKIFLSKRIAFGMALVYDFLGREGGGNNELLKHWGSTDPMQREGAGCSTSGARIFDNFNNWW